MSGSSSTIKIALESIFSSMVVTFSDSFCEPAGSQREVFSYFCCCF
jgi:hypothetical protein